MTGYSSTTSIGQTEPYQLEGLWKEFWMPDFDYPLLVMGQGALAGDGAMLKSVLDAMGDRGLLLRRGVGQSDLGEVIDHRLSGRPAQPWTLVGDSPQSACICQTSGDMGVAAQFLIYPRGSDLYIDLRLWERPTGMDQAKQASGLTLEAVQAPWFRMLLVAVGFVAAISLFAKADAGGLVLLLIIGALFVASKFQPQMERVARLPEKQPIDVTYNQTAFAAAADYCLKQAVIAYGISKNQLVSLANKQQLHRAAFK